MTPPGVLQSVHPPRRRFRTRSTPSAASTSAPATSHSRTPARIPAAVRRTIQRCPTTSSTPRLRIAARRTRPISREAPPQMPSRTAFLLAFSAVVVAGLFGGIIGYGLADVGCTGDCEGTKLIGTLLGSTDRGGRRRDRRGARAARDGGVEAEVLRPVIGRLVIGRLVFGAADRPARPRRHPVQCPRGIRSARLRVWTSRRRCTPRHRTA